MNKQISPKVISLIFAVLVICFAIGFYAFAVWQEPTLPQPGGNVPPPLNTSINPQTKAGALRLGGLTVDNDTWLAVSAGNVGIGMKSPSQKLDVDGYVKGRTGLCIGNDCRTTWPTGGGGITAVNAGTGLTGGGTSGDVTLNADTGYLQRRVTGTCGSKQAIRVINADGSVGCVNLPPSAICTWSGVTYSTGAECCAGGHRYRCGSDGAWIDLWTCVSSPGKCGE